MLVDLVVKAAVVVEVVRVVVVEEETGLDPVGKAESVHFTFLGQSQKLLSGLKTSPVGQKN